MLKKKVEKKNFGDKLVKLKKQKKLKIFKGAPLQKSNPNSMEIIVKSKANQKNILQN